MKAIVMISLIVEIYMVIISNIYGGESHRFTEQRYLLL